MLIIIKSCVIPQRVITIIVHPQHFVFTNSNIYPAFPTLLHVNVADGEIFSLTNLNFNTH